MPYLLAPSLLFQFQVSVDTQSRPSFSFSSLLFSSPQGGKKAYLKRFSPLLCSIPSHRLHTSSRRQRSRPQAESRRIAWSDRDTIKFCRLKLGRLPEAERASESVGHGGDDDGVVPRRRPAGGRHALPQRGGGGHGVARQGCHGRRHEPARHRHAAAAHRLRLPRTNCILQGEEVEAKADAGDLRLHLRQCGARRCSASVHDLRGPALHHGHLRHRLLQHRPRPHLPPRRRHALRSPEPQVQDGRGEARGHAGLAGRRHGAHPLQGRRPHQRRLAAPQRFSPPPGGGGRRQPRQVDAGHRGHPRQLRLPLLLVPAPRPPRQEVPARLLLQRPHVHVQLPPGRRRRPLHPAQHLAVDRHQQVPDPHRPIRWHRRVRRVVRAGDMVHREEGRRVRGRLHPRRADHRLRHRLLHPARAALPRKRAGISSCDRRAVPPAVGQEAGGPALPSKSCRRP